MIFSIVGNIGSGKTTFLTLWTYLYGMSGYTIYSNYNIQYKTQFGVPVKVPFEVRNISAIRDFSDISTPKNFFALDELWLTADSRRSSSFISSLASTKLLQSRKKKADAGITTQSLGQLDKRIRDITSIIYEPEIILRDPNNGKPLALKVYFYTWEEPETKKFCLPLIGYRGGISIPDSYDTYEIVESMDDGKKTIEDELVEKYADWPGSRMQLRYVIAYEEREKGIDKKAAERIANYIFALREDVKDPRRGPS